MTWPDQRSHTKQQNLDTLQKAHKSRAGKWWKNLHKIFDQHYKQSLMLKYNCFMVKEKTVGITMILWYYLI